MIVYEVALEVDQEAIEKLCQWLPGHIKQLLSLPGFVTAQWWKVDHLTDTLAKEGSFLVHYLIENRQMLDNYFANHAVKLRQEAQDLFGNQLKITRRACLFAMP